MVRRGGLVHSDRTEEKCYIRYLKYEMGKVLGLLCDNIRVLWNYTGFYSKLKFHAILGRSHNIIILG